MWPCCSLIAALRRALPSAMATALLTQCTPGKDARSRSASLDATTTAPASAPFALTGTATPALSPACSNSSRSPRDATPSASLSMPTRNSAPARATSSAIAPATRRAQSSPTCSWLVLVHGWSAPSSPRRRKATQQRFQWRSRTFENDSQTSRSECGARAENACSLSSPTTSAESACCSPVAAAQGCACAVPDALAATDSSQVEPETPEPVLDFCLISTGMNKIFRRLRRLDIMLAEILSFFVSKVIGIEARGERSQAVNNLTRKIVRYKTGGPLVATNRPPVCDL